jgi:hypothetical protein
MRGFDSTRTTQRRGVAPREVEKHKEEHQVAQDH